MGNDEGRVISAGVSHWYDGQFRLANDSPPLGRMVAVLPLLPLGLGHEAQPLKETDPGSGLGLLDRELDYAGRFARINLGSFNFFYLARMTGFLWWLAGGWIVTRWTINLHGHMSGYIGITLWACAPQVLAHEQLATSALPAAVIAAAATYAFRGYMLSPSWDRALLVGLLLGVAQLVEFTSLTLLIIWPILALIHFLTRVGVPSPAVKSRTRILHAASAVALGLCVINLGYGFDGTGSSLGSFDFASEVLKGDPRPSVERLATEALGNRFRGSWLARVIIPLPANYLRGLDRRWHDRAIAPAPVGGDAGGSPPDPGGHPSSRDVGRMPIGISLMMLGGLFLPAALRPAGVSRSEELALWLPPLIFLAMTTRTIGLLDPVAGVLLATPYAIVIACKILRPQQEGRRATTWLAVAVVLGSAGECVEITRGQQFTIDRTTRFRQDLVRQGRRLGLAVPERKSSSGAGAGERGLLYRDFTDSRGERVNYALYMPKDYRSDRPHPLILFLHGYGDRGTSGRAFTEVGLPFTLKYRAIGSLVLCPQGRSGTWEADGDDARRALELLAAVRGEYAVDPKRIALTGLSSGGTGAWGLAARYPGRWSAIVPVAGSCDPGQAPAIAHVPCWCFHNRYDGVIPVDRPREMIGALRAEGGSPNYTEFSDVNHNAGERAYVLPELYDWLSRQRLP